MSEAGIRFGFALNVAEEVMDAFFEQIFGLRTEQEQRCAGVLLEGTNLGVAAGKQFEDEPLLAGNAAAGRTPVDKNWLFGFYDFRYECVWDRLLQFDAEA